MKGRPVMRKYPPGIPFWPERRASNKERIQEGRNPIAEGDFIGFLPVTVQLTELLHILRERCSIMKKGLALLLSCVMGTALIAGCGGTSGSADGSAGGADSQAAGSESSAGADAAQGESGAASGEAGDSQGSNGAADGQTFTIGICQQLEHAALDEATRGFQEACNELFGEGNVTIEVQNAQGEQANCSTIANNFVASDVDLILANGTTALQSCAAATNQIPILGTSITDYGAALDITDWTGASGTNISGTSDLAPIDEQAAMLVELVPDVTKVGIVYCSAEANSAYQADEFAKALDAQGIAYSQYTAADSNEIPLPGNTLDGFLLSCFSPRYKILILQKLNLSICFL